MARFATPNWRALALAVVGTVGLGAGCGSAAPDTQSIDAGLFYSCATETRAIPYAPGLKRTSMSGAFEAVLVKSDPGPPVKGINVWTVQIFDGSGATPQDGLTVTALPYMPDHRHPSTVIPVVTPKDDGTGTYTLDPVYLFMPGYWEVTLTLQPATGAKDSVVFPICISN